MVKDLFRYTAGLMARDFGLQEVLREVYFVKARSFIQKLDPALVSGIWARRSMTNQDFTPFWSDIDLTIVVKDQADHSLRLMPDLLVKDIQFLSEAHLDDWLLTGGYRNYALGSWVRLGGSIELTTHDVPSQEILAFELVQELYLLYHQLESKLHGSSWNPLKSASVYKLLAEIERVHLFWKTRDNFVFDLTRDEILAGKTLTESLVRHQLNRMDQLMQALLEKLSPPMNAFDLSPLVARQDQDGLVLYLMMMGKQVLICENQDRMLDVLKHNPDKFVTTSAFLTAVKGVGVQEQHLLNLAAKNVSYYFRFNRQRLANDLISAFHLNPEDQSVLYYCFKNINEFYRSRANVDSPGWQTLQERWERTGTVFSNSGELSRLTSGHLEVLKGLS